MNKISYLLKLILFYKEVMRSNASNCNLNIIFIKEYLSIFCKTEKLDFETRGEEFFENLLKVIKLKFKESQII